METASDEECAERKPTASSDRRALRGMGHSLLPAYARSNPKDKAPPPTLIFLLDSPTSRLPWEAHRRHAFSIRKDCPMNARSLLMSASLVLLAGLLFVCRPLHGQPPAKADERPADRKAILDSSKEFEAAF